MNFTPIDIKAWNRGDLFYYFSQIAPTGYSLTMEIDITALRKTLKKADLKLFPAYLWLITKNLDRHVEFKIAERDGVLGYYDGLTPLYAAFHKDSKTISLMWTEYCDNFLYFYDAYIENQRLYGDNHSLLSQPQAPPENAYTVSVLPWVKFSGFSLHSYGNKPYYFPTVEAGKLYDNDGKIIMPLSMTCHHAATDGQHIHQFLKELEEDINGFEKYL